MIQYFLLNAATNISFLGRSGMAEAPLIERFDCGKLIVIEDSEQELKKDRVKNNGIGDIRKHSVEGDISTALTSPVAKETKEFDEFVNKKSECNGDSKTIGIQEESLIESDDQFEILENSESSIKMDDNDNQSENKVIISSQSKSLINYHRKNGAQLVQCSGCYDNML